MSNSFGGFRKQAQRKKGQPSIGIWWDDGRTLAILAHAVNENASSGPLIDSELNHMEEWSEVAAQFRLTESDEYFGVPRGRTLLDRRTGAGVIYHGNGTTGARLCQIARAFGLARWRAERKKHYDMSPDADKLFEEECGDD